MSAASSSARTIIVSAAVIRETKGGKVLLTRRMEGAHLAGMWEFPGGKVEAGEHPEAALIRECKEECALEIEVRDILDVAWHRYEKKDVLLLFYDCGIVSGQIQHLGVADHAWVAPADLDRYPLPPPDTALVTKLKAGR
jgi:8-oxo-dGTP diphosphatase